MRSSDDEAAQHPGPRRHSLPLACLAFLAVLYTMYFAATLLIPVIVALLLYFLLEPIVAGLVSFRVPRVIAALLVTSCLLGGAAMTLYQLSDPGVRWLRDAPTSLEEFRAKLRSRPNPLTEVRNASEAVEDAVAEITGSDDSDSVEAPEVEIREPGALDTVLGQLPFVAASALVTVVLSLFLLLYGDRFMRRLVSLGGSFASRRRIVVTVRQIERDIARYLRTITLINIGLGAVVMSAMHWLGLPNPLLWGAVACVMNFAPYVGAVITALTLLLAGFGAFDTTGAMFAPMLVFLLITAAEGQLITPMLLGRRLELSPLVVLLSVLLVGWLWGLMGALIAVPLVASIRIVLANMPQQSATAKLLAR